MVENSLGFLFTCTLEAQITSLNAYTAETLGYQIKDLTGQPVSLFLAEGGAAVFLEGLQSSRPGKNGRARLRVRRSDGVFRASLSAAAAWSCPANGHSSSTTAWTYRQHEAEEALHVATHQRELILESVGTASTASASTAALPLINQARANSLAIQTSELTRPRYSRGHPASPRRRHALLQEQQPILQAMRRREPFVCATRSSGAADGATIPSSTAPRRSWKMEEISRHGRRLPGHLRAPTPWGG